MQAKAIETSEELEFAVFCVEALAERLGIGGSQAYALLRDSGDVLGTYAVPCYDVLHTQGRDFVADDLLDVLRERGAAA